MGTNTSSKILVLEDDRTSARAVACLLEETGHSVEVANDAARAVEIAAGWTPDLLLTDIFLDDSRTGFDVVTELRDGHCGDGLPVVVMTGLTNEEITRYRGDREVFAVLNKPLVVADLERTVSAALASRSHGEE